MKNTPLKWKILSIAFLIAIFYIGSATIPQTAKNISALSTVDRREILETKDKIDGEYRDMLDFTHSNFKNKGAYAQGGTGGRCLFAEAQP